jgi:murein DD-endopeptidase MepM/ murein hydrolase activator NlpD
MKIMTNNIELTNRQKNIIPEKAFVSKQTYLLADSSFNNLFSTFIADINSTSSFGGEIETSTNLLDPIMMLMFQRLFGIENPMQLNITNPPQGLPVIGVLTQTCREGHVALDFGVPIGTNIKSTMDGNVTYAGWNNEGYGNLVIVDNGEYQTYYAHLSTIPVTIGQKVSSSDIIGISGNTGNSTGPHLHYEIRKNGVAIDPRATIGQ